MKIATLNVISLVLSTISLALSAFRCHQLGLIQEAIFIAVVAVLVFGLSIWATAFAVHYWHVCKELKKYEQ